MVNDRLPLTYHAFCAVAVRRSNLLPCKQRPAPRYSNTSVMLGLNEVHSPARLHFASFDTTKSAYPFQNPWMGLRNPKKRKQLKGGLYYHIFFEGFNLFQPSIFGNWWLLGFLHGRLHGRLTQVKAVTLLIQHLGCSKGLGTGARAGGKTQDMFRPV